MKRERNKLTAAKISKADTAGLLGDGFGLYLQVSKFWSVEYRDEDGKTKGRSFDKESAAEEYQIELRSKGIDAKIGTYVTKSWLFRFMR